MNKHDEAPEMPPGTWESHLSATDIVLQATVGEWIPLSLLQVSGQTIGFFLESVL